MKDFKSIDEAKITLRAIVGDMDDNGRFPGMTKFAPKYAFIVVVMEMAFLSRSIIHKWLVPWSWIWFHLQRQLSKTQNSLLPQISMQS